MKTALFPGYLFCRLDVNHRLALLTGPGVESIAGMVDVPSPPSGQ